MISYFSLVRDKLQPSGDFNTPNQFNFTSIHDAGGFDRLAGEVFGEVAGGQRSRRRRRDALQSAVEVGNILLGGQNARCVIDLLRNDQVLDGKLVRHLGSMSKSRLT